MLVDFNQPIFSLSKFSCPSGFNLCEGLSEVLLVNGIDYAKQEISLDVIFCSILEIGQICHNLLVSLNLLHDVLDCQLRASWNFERKDFSTKKVLFLPTENISDKRHRAVPQLRKENLTYTLV
jgi:hypothetical protein